MKKIILAYSGGLDTSCCVHWLISKGYKVICFSANLGSEFSPIDLRRRAIKSGAEKIYVKDLKKEFAYEYILPALKAGACYEGKYLLSTALGRPLIAKYMVDIAKKEGAKFVAHGCSSKGNDQVRFDVSVNILNPKLKIIAPLREWNLTSREKEIDYAKKHKIPIKISKDKIYSIDKNIWGISVEGGSLEELEKKVPDDTYYLTRLIKKADDKSVIVDIEFGKGIPFKLNGKRMFFVKMIEKLNKIGARAGIGRTDLIEDRTVGIKSREIYEAPAAWILHTAHRELENLTLDRETLFFKEIIASKYAQLAYQGFWFSNLKDSLDAFVSNSQNRVSGSITFQLYKGNITVVKRKARNSLYKKELSTYGEGDKFNKAWAKGFIKLWGMPYIK